MTFLRKYSFFILFLVLTSCESMLEPKDENRPDEDFLISHPENAEGLMLNAYHTLETQMGWGKQIYTYYSSTGTDDAVSNQTNSGYRRMVTGELTSDYNPIGTERWDNNYQAVFYLNKFLSIVDKVQWEKDEAVNALFIRRLTGEALALRAIHHFLVLECFAGRSSSGELLGVPYFDGFLTADTDFINYQRLPFEENIDKIMQDLDKAYEYLPWVYSDNETDIPEKDKDYDPVDYLFVNGAKYSQRITGEIVRAYQARVMLFAGSEAYLDDRSYNERATEYAVEILSRKDFTLAPDGIEFYDSDDDFTNPEILWRISQGDPISIPEENNLPPSLNGKGFINPTQNFVDAFYMKDGYPVGQSPDLKYDPQNPYKNRDKRLGMFVIYNGSKFQGKKIDISPESEKDGLNMVASQSTRTGYYLKKLLRPDAKVPVTGKPTSQRHILPLIRYTEIFLILAEAQNKAGGPDWKAPGSNVSARDVMRLIRERAMNLKTDPYLDGISDEVAMRDLIRNERRLELSFEGFRFWDLRRWDCSLDEPAMGYYDDGTGYKEFEVEPRLLSGEKYKALPLPVTEVRKFRYEQNRGW